MSAYDCPVVESPEFLLAALEQAKDAVVVVDNDLRVRQFNAAAEQIWGIPRAQILGCDASVLGLDELHQQQDATPAPGGPGCEMTVQRHDGGRVRVALSVSQVEAGGQSNYMVLARDIRTEAAQRERLAVMALVADNSSRAVIVTDRDLNIIYANAAFAEMFGYSIEEATGRHAEQLLAGRHTDRRTLTRLRREVGDGSGGEEEILLYDKNGDESWVAATIQAFRSHSGRVKYIFALMTDITETRQLRSLQQLIMAALADEIPITEIADRLCRRVEIIAPDVVSSLLHVDAEGLLHSLGGPSLRRNFRARSTASPSGRIWARAARLRFTASPCWRRTSIPTRAGSRSRPSRWRPACAPAGRRQSRPRTAA